MLGNNTGQSVLALAAEMLEGEILIREEKLEERIAKLRTAVTMEDALKYDEPPGWLIPVRHALGATLMQAGRHAEAEELYRDDLKRSPDNGWALRGLVDSLREQKKDADEVHKLQARFRTIWAKADLKITSSWLCQPARAR